MSKRTNILVITYWKLADPLVQTYTLPYLRIIRDVIGESANIHLLTLEDNPADSNELEDRITNVQLSYKPFGPKSVLEWRSKIKELVSYCDTHHIDTLHSWCTPGGAVGYLIAKKTKLPLMISTRV